MFGMTENDDMDFVCRSGRCNIFIIVFATYVVIPKRPGFFLQPSLL
jgi:hypothetical protein